MSTLAERKEINKILTRIQSIARQGTAGYRDFDSYINELLTKKKINLLQQCAEIYFELDRTKTSNLGLLKNVLWDKSLSLAKLPFLERLDRILKNEGVYQIGNEIRDLNNINLLFDLSPTLDENLQVVATASKVDFVVSGNSVSVNLNDPNISEISISNVDWATYSTSPKSIKPIHKITAGTYYDTLTYNGSTDNKDLKDLVACTNSVVVDESLDGLNRIDLQIELTHSFVGDLQINLMAPNGRVINAKRQGGVLDKGKNLNVTFSNIDVYERLIRTTKDGITGTYRMDKLIGIGDAPYVSDVAEVKKMLQGQSTLGAWTLFVKDVGTLNEGTLNGWKLILGAQRFNDYCTQSSYVTDIPTTQGGVYHVEVTKKNPYGKFLYRLDVTKDDLLGTATEVDFTSTVDANYYVRNKRVMEILGQKKYYVEVKAKGSQEIVTMMSEDPTLSEESNLLVRYRQAVAYLKDQSNLTQVVNVISVVTAYPNSPKTLDRYLHITDGIIEWSGDRWEYPLQYNNMRILVSDTNKTLKYNGTTWE